MHNGAVPGMIRDYILLAMLGGAAVLAKILRDLLLRRKHAARISWPMTEARFERGDITGARVEVRFAYAVSGNEYPGFYSEDCTHRDEAERVLGSLRNGPLYVRYNPSDAADYFIDPYRDIRLNPESC
jgi:hypothetical protein